MKLLLLLFSFVLCFKAFPAALQCYQCTHELSNPDDDCINADIKYLKECTGNDATQWDCDQRWNHTTSGVLYVYRECVPRGSVTECVLRGADDWSWTYLRCYCNLEDGCNDIIPRPIGNSPTTTVSDGDDGNNGSVNLRLSSNLVVVYMLVYSLRSWIF